MKVKNIRGPPREFWYECPKCGTYRVSEGSVREFLTPVMETVLNDRLKSGAAGAKLKFKSCCPLCQSEGRLDFEIIALKPRVH